MALELNVPDLGEGLTEAEIVQWLVKVGDPVTANQPIVEVETAKAVVEISAPRAGVLAHHGAEAGATLEVGQLLAVITEEGETWTGGEGGTASDGAGDPVPAAAAAVPEGAAAASSAAKPGAGGPVKAVPLVRRLAKDLGVDLATITGTGPGGRITREDVESAAAAGPPATAATGVATGDVAEELSATRRAIAANLTRSWTEIPHVTIWGPADASAVLAARRESGGPLEAYLVRAVLPVLVEFPELNATFDGTTLTKRTTVNMGIAVDTEAGLVVPVLSDVGTRSPSNLANRIETMITAAKTRKLAPDDMTGGTFTISNVGAVGGGYGTPIIPHGTTAILSVGRAKEEVIARSGGIHVAPMFPIALSFDHRVIDGATASRFLTRYTEELEGFGIRGSS